MQHSSKLAHVASYDFWKVVAQGVVKRQPSVNIKACCVRTDAWAGMCSTGLNALQHALRFTSSLRKCIRWWNLKYFISGFACFSKESTSGYVWCKYIYRTVNIVLAGSQNWT